MSVNTPGRGSWLSVRRWLGYGALGLLGLLGLLAAALRVASQPVPRGQAGLAADALAHRVEAAVRLPAWHATGAVRFTFMGRHRHVWDRHANRHHVRWDDREVVIDLHTRRGCARVGGVEQTGASRDGLLTRAYALWTNDTFWFNPFGKLFDPGVVRQVVHLPEQPEALLVTFTARGLTPGDSYLWLLDAQGRPTAFRIWTRIPIGGLQVSWEGFRALATGAMVATRHRALGLSLQIDDVAGAADLQALLAGEPDPFAWCNVR